MEAGGWRGRRLEKGMASKQSALLMCGPFLEEHVKGRLVSSEAQLWERPTTASWPWWGPISPMSFSCLRRQHWLSLPR